METNWIKKKKKNRKMSENICWGLKKNYLKRGTQNTTQKGVKQGVKKGVRKA